MKKKIKIILIDKLILKILVYFHVKLKMQNKYKQK
jgi:hypothetical protein